MQSVPLRVSRPSPVRCLASSGRGGLPGPFPPVPGSGSCPSSWAGLCVRGGPAPGGWGGGGGLCAALPLGRGWGAPRAGGSVYLGPSLCLPLAGTKAGVIGVAKSMEGVVSIVFRFMSAC